MTVYARAMSACLLSLVLGIAPAMAQDDRAPQNLNVLGAVHYALTHAPVLLAREYDIASAVSAFVAKQATEYPSIAGQLQNEITKSSNLNGAFAAYGITPVNNFSQNTAQVVSQYNLYSGTAQLAAEQAKRYVQNASGEFQAQEETTVLGVSTDYYNLVALYRALALDEGDLAYQQELLDVARAQERVGRVAGVDVLRAQVAVSRSEATLVQARADEGNAQDTLAVEIGASPTATFALPADLPEPPLPHATIQALTAIATVNRPEIAAAQATLEAARLGDAAIDTDLRPTVQMNGSFGSQISPTNFVLEQQEVNAQNAAALANYNLEKVLFPGTNFPSPILTPPITRGGAGFWQFGITSTFTFPFIDYGTRAANHHAARAQIASAKAAYQSAIDSVERDVRAAVRNVQAAYDKLTLAKASAGLARESARIAQLQYKNGIISFTDVTQTEQTALSAENDLVAARVAYVVADIRLRLTLGPADPAGAANVENL
jgi:multidrug efflux system outer membrane protein